MGEYVVDLIITPTSRAGASGKPGAVHLLLHVGFEERIRGSHHIFTREDSAEILNLQPKGNKAKPYQVRQVRHVVLKYKLAGGTQ
ncbi:hypothetical protein BH23GEM5_BH23GEM5_16800 [soil metagenome]